MMRDTGVKLMLGDCLKLLPRLATGSVDAVVTDPPAGISFMGQRWDTFLRRRDLEPNRGGVRDGQHPQGFGRGTGKEDHSPRGRSLFIAFLSAVAAEHLRILRPGAYGLVWAIPRTSHWTATALEDAGFEIRDCITHLFGQGFPKAKCCLKPAAEFWWLVRKPARRMTPLPGLDACRIEGEVPQVTQGVTRRAMNGEAIYGAGHGVGRAPQESNPHPNGRWPANVVLDVEAAAMLDEQAGPQVSGGTPARRFADKTRNAYGRFNGQENPAGIGGSAGNVSRFFYVAKAGRRERNAGLDDLPERDADLFGDDPYTVRRNGDGKPTNGDGTVTAQRNHHPTVKPLALMRWLCRLITPPGGLILDPFLGSGSTGCAAALEGFGFIGIERDAGYMRIARRRIAAARKEQQRAARFQEDLTEGEL